MTQENKNAVSAVVVSVEMPPRDSDAWTTFMTITKDARASKATKSLAECVWLIDLQKSPAAFAQLVHACEQQRLPYLMLAIEHEPRWLPGGFDPEPIQA